MLPIIASAAGTALASWAVRRLLDRLVVVKEHKSNDRKLDVALEDSMDCSDPVAKY